MFCSQCRTPGDFWRIEYDRERMGNVFQCYGYNENNSLPHRG